MAKGGIETYAHTAWSTQKRQRETWCEREHRPGDQGQKQIDDTLSLSLFKSTGGTASEAAAEAQNLLMKSAAASVSLVVSLSLSSLSLSGLTSQRHARTQCTLATHTQQSMA